TIARMSAQKFVTKIAVAVFHIHEIETRGTGQSCGHMETIDELANVAVGKHGIVVGQAQPLIEQRMAIENARPTMAVPSRMCELKTDEQAIIASAFPPMFRHQRLAQVLDVTHRPLADQKLIGIRPPVLSHGDGFAAPDEFRAAHSEMLPTTNG